MSGKLEAVLLHVIGLLKTDVEDYCDLETIDGGRAIVAQDGSLASIVRFNGTKSVLGREQFERLIQLLDGSFSVYFKNRGHQLQVVFRRDLDARGALERNAIQQRSTADRLSLGIHDLIDESVEKYSQYVYDEDCYLVFWSRPALLDTVEAKLATQATNEFRKESNWPATSDAQNLLRPISYLRDRHLSFVSKITDDLSSPEFGCSVDVLDVDEALRSVRRSVYPDLTTDDWKAAIPGTKIPFRWKSNGDIEDMSELLYPPLPRQIMTATAEIGKNGSENLPDSNTVRVGSRVYAPLMVAVPPREPQYFNTLFNSLNRAETRENGVTRALPYSISFMLESDGMSVMAFKFIFASLLSITSEQNRNINLATKALNEYRRDGGCIVKLRIAAMTWAGIDPDGIKELALRKSKLWRTLEGWGNPVVLERTGNPMIAFQTNALGLTTKHIGEPCPAPLDDAIALLPLTRPASPFSTGSTIYRSLDGKILRYQRFSSEQTTWITLISGKPGSGKSVLMNNNNVECCLMPGITRLPYIGIIDIGVSSSGFIDLIRDSLPENMRHLAIYKRLQNSERDCINPMDTPLGKREPLPKDREFIKNFLSILVTPPERRGKPYEGMSNFVGRMIDLAFQKKSDRLEKASPETYKPGHNAVVDEAVAKLGYKILPATTYWELVDALFKAGYIYEAEVAQRYAVPTLNDLVGVASSEEVEAEYGGVMAEGNRPLIKAFSLGIREAVGDYPIFSSHTRFDIGSARVISLDLQDVAIIGSDSAYKQTALMYMIARQSFMKKVAFSKEDLPYFDDLYKPYYDRLINDIVDENKVLCMDEFHKTGGHDGLKLQVLTDGREARKWNLEIILASQLMEDFGELTKIATALFILDSGTEETRRWLRDNIGLKPVEESALVNYVHGANAHGATFLARFSTKNATYSQLFTMTAGAMRLWALSTTAEDRKLRGLLYESMPRQQARRLLAKRFPGGSCKKLVERLKEETFRGADFVDDDMESSVIERLAKELIHEYYNSTELEVA
ncbi:type IV secretion protein DotO [Salmonella enterica]|nr:type IV secretion protein DotO [Salmonella enterica]EIQ2412564.1 type IV secretion protein DotO [Salmonella enterica]